MNNVLSLAELRAKVAPFAIPSNIRAWFEVGITLLLFAVAITIAVILVNYSPWLAPIAGIPSGFMLVRLFILQHDCGHGSLFHSKVLNRVLGRVLAFPCLTPFAYWQHMHRDHHVHTGELDTKRGVGNIWLYTTSEYAMLDWKMRLAYRAYHHPVVLHLIGPTLLFAGLYRLWWIESLASDRRSMVMTNLVLLIAIIGLVSAFDPLNVFLVIAPMTVIGSTIGAWKFFVQHSFEKSYFAHDETYDKRLAIVRGCSHLHLPKWLDWLTGWIGHHALHHLNSHIPCYRLKKCWEATKEYFAETPRFTIGETFRFIGLALWDEKEQKMVRFSALPRPV